MYTVDDTRTVRIIFFLCVYIVTYCNSVEHRNVLVNMNIVTTGIHWKMYIVHVCMVKGPSLYWFGSLSISYQPFPHSTYIQYFTLLLYTNICTQIHTVMYSTLLQLYNKTHWINLTRSPAEVHNQTCTVCGHLFPPSLQTHLYSDTACSLS